MKHGLKAEWDVQADGTFTLHEALDDAAETIDWTGAIDSSLRVTGVLVSHATCNGVEHESHTQLAGKVFRGKAGPELQLAGNESRCPKQGCVFELHYVLEKQ